MEICCLTPCRESSGEWRGGSIEGRERREAGDGWWVSNVFICSSVFLKLYHVRLQFCRYVIACVYLWNHTDRLALRSPHEQTQPSTWGVKHGQQQQLFHWFDEKSLHIPQGGVWQEAMSLLLALLPENKPAAAVMSQCSEHHIVYGGAAKAACEITVLLLWITNSTMEMQVISRT